MQIKCKKCGSELAERKQGRIYVKGVLMPTDGIDGIILICACKRRRTYYFSEDEDCHNPECMQIIRKLEFSD